MAGITIGGLEVQSSFASNGLRFHFIRGGLQSLATFVGEDDDLELEAFTLREGSDTNA